MNEYPNPIEVITKTILWLAAVLVISTFIGFTIGLPIALLFRTISR
jgi:hypothetical protein